MEQAKTSDFPISLLHKLYVLH